MDCASLPRYQPRSKPHPLPYRYDLSSLEVMRDSELLLDPHMAGGMVYVLLEYVLAEILRCTALMFLCRGMDVLPEIPQQYKDFH